MTSNYAAFMTRNSLGISTQVPKFKMCIFTL